MPYSASTSSSSADNDQPSSSSPALRLVHIGRDQNVNNGPGSLIVNNNNRITQESRPIRWYIQGTEAEEAEYDQYGEYRRGDIQLLRMIHRRNLEKWDRKTHRHVFDCEQSVWLGEIVSGNEKGTIVTVECYQGQGAPEVWKHGFQRYSVNLSASDAHLLGLNRSKIPLLIFLGELVPIKGFAKNIRRVGQYYLDCLGNHWGWVWGSGGVDLWMDMRKGVFCRGPIGPSLDMFVVVGLDRIENPVTTTDLLKEEVLIRYLASLKKKGADRQVVHGIVHVGLYSSYDVDVRGSVDQPTVFCTLTDTPIAVANNVWEDLCRDNFVEQKQLGDGWTRFRLVDSKHRTFNLQLNWDARRPWVSAALSIFHALGISLEGDLSVYNLVVPRVWCEGDLSDSSDSSELRQRQPIYLFIHPSPLSNLLPDGRWYTTTSFHYWSFHESGQPPLTPEICHTLGLPAELQCRKSFISWSWPTDRYKLLRQYLVPRGFDPTTTDFAPHLEYGDYAFRPINNSDRFKVVDEGCPTDTDSDAETDADIDSNHSSENQRHENNGASTSHCSRNMPVPGDALVNSEADLTTSDHVANKHQRFGNSTQDGGDKNRLVHGGQDELCQKNETEDGRIIQEPSSIQQLHPLPPEHIALTDTSPTFPISSVSQTLRSLEMPQHEADLASDPRGLVLRRGSSTQSSEIINLSDDTTVSDGKHSSQDIGPTDMAQRRTMELPDDRPSTTTNEQPTTDLTQRLGFDENVLQAGVDDVGHRRLSELEHEGTLYESTKEVKVQEEGSIVCTELEPTNFGSNLDGGVDTTSRIQKHSFLATWWLVFDCIIVFWCLFLLSMQWLSGVFWVYRVLSLWPQ
ncbi:hypothetical protein PM082_023711 [Marasmius tenuissimus]|nr:hypothetical protein PM082_023711 [Marasmius tenuissimus]